MTKSGCFCPTRKVIGSSRVVLSRFRRSHVHPDVRVPRDANGTGAGEQVSHRITGRAEGRTGEASRREPTGAAEYNHQSVCGEPDEAVGDRMHGRERIARSPLPPLHLDGLSTPLRRHQETHGEGIHPRESILPRLFSHRPTPSSPRPSTRLAAPFSSASQSWTPLPAITC